MRLVWSESGFCQFEEQTLFGIILDKETRHVLDFMHDMKPAPSTATPDELIHGRGLRMTEQRRAVYDALMEERNHPTAVEVFMKARTSHVLDFPGDGL